MHGETQDRLVDHVSAPWLSGLVIPYILANTLLATRASMTPTDPNDTRMRLAAFEHLRARQPEQAARVALALDLILVSRHLERIGDHATNVAEMVYFAATGLYYSDRDMSGGKEKVI